MSQLFNNAKRRLLAFMEISLDLHVGLTRKGVWEIDFHATNDLIEETPDSEPLSVIGFRVDAVDTEDTAIK